MQAPADAVPAQLVWDTFTGATVGLGAHKASKGQPWNVIMGTLQMTGGRVRCTSCSAANGAAVIDGDMAQVTATVNLALTATAGTPGKAGLWMNADAFGTQAIVVWWDSGIVRLFRYTGGPSSSWPRRPRPDSPLWTRRWWSRTPPAHTPSRSAAPP